MNDPAFAPLRPAMPVSTRDRIADNITETDEPVPPEQPVPSKNGRRRKNKNGRRKRHVAGVKAAPRRWSRPDTTTAALNKSELMTFAGIVQSLAALPLLSRKRVLEALEQVYP